MKKYLGIIFLCLFAQLAWSQSGKGYDPENPADPDVYYKLSVEASPKKGGSVSPSSPQQLSAGATVHCFASAKMGYVFRNWMIGDSVVSYKSDINYTMPEDNAVLVAYFDWVGNEGYNPDSPDDPFAEGYQHKVTLYATPSAGGSFNSRSFYMTDGSTTRVYAYPNSGYRFVSWKKNGKIVSTSNPLEITMGSENQQFTAQFVYDPANPANPGANSFNPATGELIIDDFEPGRLSSAIYNTVGSSENYSSVKSIVVIGAMQAGDFGFLHEMDNCSSVDISRTTGYNDIPDYAFEGASSLISIILPYSVESVGHHAFSGCSSLSTLFCYATTPPAVSSTAFSDVPSGLKVLVPSLSLELYKNAEGWKDFILSALDGETNTLTVSLPDDAKDGRYRNMTLELDNITSGQVSRMLISDRTRYSFVNLIHETKYNVFVKNSRSVVLGEIRGVEIADKDVEIGFNSLKQPQTVTLSVNNEKGEDLTASVNITWLDENGTYLCTGNTISGFVEGTVLKYRVKLSNETSLYYVAPQDSTYCVKPTDNDFVCILTPQQLIAVTGYVRNINTKKGIFDASVSISQQTSGRQSRTVVAKTDMTGMYSAEVYNSPASIFCTAHDYVNKRLDVESFVDAEGGVTLEDIGLNSTVGATVNVRLTYQESVLEGAMPEIQNWYDDYVNVALSVFNLTTGLEVTQISNRYPQFVLMEGVKVGDRLRLTVSSKKNAFEPVEVEAVVDSSEVVDAAFAIKQFGVIQASYKATKNDVVVGILYNSHGQLQQKMEFADGTITFSGLRDGEYDIVTMGKNDSYNSIYMLSRIKDAGLTEGVDYNRNKVNVQRGVIKNLSIENVPFLNLAKFHTINNEKSSLTVNKSSLVAGNYLTFTGYVEMENKEVTIVDNMRLIVDIPSSASFVKGSVMLGDQVVDSYTFEGNTLTVPFNNTGSQNKIKFCVIPTEEGKFQPSAMVGFKVNEEDVIIPIGSTAYSVSNISIEVTNRTPTESVIISGCSPANAPIIVYDNDEVIGSLKADAYGNWSGSMQLNNAYNLSKHDIYAQIAVGELVLTTNHVECKVFTNDIVVTTIKMSHYNDYKRANETIVIDYQNQTVDKKSYDFYHTAQFTFNVDFNRNDTTCIDNVVVISWNTRDEATRLPATYSESTNNWVATGTFSSDNLPSSVDVEYDVYGLPIIPDRENLDANTNLVNYAGNSMKSELEYLNEILTDTTNLNSIDKHYYRLEELLSGEDISMEELDRLLGSVMDTSICYQVDDSELNNRINLFLDRHQAEDMELFLDTMIGEYTNSDFLDFSPGILNDVESLKELSNKSGSQNYTIEKTVSIDEQQLLLEGYQTLSFTDSSCIFYLYSDKGLSIVDPKREMKISLDYPLEANRAATKADPSIVINPDKWAHCISSIKSYVNILTWLGNSPSTDIKQQLSEIGKTLNDLADGVNCFYFQFFGDVELKLKNKYNEATKLLKEVINDNTSIIDDLTARINSSNNEIKRLKFENSLLDPVKDAQQLRNNNARIKELFETISVDNKSLRNLRLTLENQKKALKAIDQWFDNCISTIRKLPRTIASGTKLGKTINVIGKLSGFFGVIVEAYSLYLDILDASNEIQEWGDLIRAMDAKYPCKGDRDRLDALYEACTNDCKKIKSHLSSVICSETVALLADLASITVKHPHIIFGEWVFSGILNGYAEIVKNCVVYTGYVNERGNYYVKLSNLKCSCQCDINGNGCKCPKGTCICKRCCNKCKCKEGGKCTCTGSCKCKPKKPKFTPQIDPSGFVYEGIFDNRLEGVTTTCYQKESVEDMYGDLHDNVTMWDAEEYGQENPLLTDNDGFYQWFVPEGLWQVKYEKEGYETAYSEWLPVPPPQLDVNMGLVQNRQPEVKEAHAYKDGVEITFDKYMMPAYLTADNIMVSQNGKYVEGRVTLVDETVAYRDTSVKYASSVRFIPEKDLSAGNEVTLVVANKVKSYAGIPMAETFAQSFDIEKEVKAIVADSLVKVPYQGRKIIKLYVHPADAAMGKTMHAVSSSEMLATLDEKDVTINEYGMAQFTVKGELPGTTGITFSMDGTNKTATSVVIIGDYTASVVSAPSASIATGTTVAKGTKIALSCETEGATIYYTLDGTCPCNEATRYVYSDSIIINESVTIKTMAVAEEMTESNIVEFVYYVNETDIEAVDDNESFRVYPIPVRGQLNISAGERMISGVTLTSVNGITVMETLKSATLVSLDVSPLPQGIYIVKVVTENATYSRKIMKVE